MKRRKRRENGEEETPKTLQGWQGTTRRVFHRHEEARFRPSRGRELFVQAAQKGACRLLTAYPPPPLPTHTLTHFNFFFLTTEHKRSGTQTRFQCQQPQRLRFVVAKPSPRHNSPCARLSASQSCPIVRFEIAQCIEAFCVGQQEETLNRLYLSYVR